MIKCELDMFSSVCLHFNFFEVPTIVPLSLSKLTSVCLFLCLFVCLFVELAIYACKAI